jgi:hypothetical protein
MELNPCFHGVRSSTLLFFDGSFAFPPEILLPILNAWNLLVERI